MFFQINHIDELLQELGPGGDEDEGDPDGTEENEEDWETDEEEEMDQN